MCAVRSPDRDHEQQLIIGIDGSRLTTSERTGTETYTASLLAAMGRLESPERFRVYLNASTPPVDLPSTMEPIGMSWPRLWTHARLSWEMARHAPDLLFIPAHVVPLVHPPTVVTIHDLGYLHEADAYPPMQRLHLAASTRWSVRVARRVIAVSQTTLRDLIARLSVPADRIRVVHHGVDPIYRPLPPAAVAEARARYQLPAEFVFTVGTIQPRKNLGTLARAMRTVAANGLPHHLVIAGKRGWFADRVEREVAASGMAGRVRWLGYVPAADLPALYNAADAFCLPSRSEGFGLPVLEAMACGVPCLLADRAALPEVAGDAALLADPSDRDAFGAALVHLLGNPELRLRLSGAGKERTGEFTWDRCASQTLTVLREALDQGKPS